MNIVFIYERKIIPTAGGVERVSSLLASEFSRRGHSVSFLSVGPEDLNRDDYVDAVEGIPQFHIPSGEPAVRFDDFFSSQVPDVAIIQGFHPSVMSMLPLIPKEVEKLMVYHNKPFAMAPHEREIYRRRPWSSLTLKGKAMKLLALVCPGLVRRLFVRRGSNLFRRLAAHVDRIVLLSDRYVPRVKRYAPGLDPEKLLAVNNPNTFALGTYIADSKKENVVLFVGRLYNAQKNVTDFIDAWKVFHATHPDWKAIVLGDGEDRDFIHRYAKRRGVSDLSFEGNRSNVADYYRQAKLLCMTSAYEGWPMVLAEAMAYGCVPVVYDSFEAVHDIIESDVNGIIVPPFRPNEMAKALSSLADDEPRRERLAAAGEESVADFSVEAIVSEWEKYLNDYVEN